MTVGTSPSGVTPPDGTSPSGVTPPDGASPVTPPAEPKPPLLERLGVDYFRRLSEAHGPVEAEDEIHVLNADERARLKRIQRGAIIRSAVAGALSTVVAGVAEILAQPLLGANPDTASWSDQARFWGIVGGATILASIIEIGYIYWDTLRAVHDLSRAAGLDLFPAQDDDAATAAAMARAALEIPNPNTRLFGVDPHRETSRLRLVAASLAYKAKISVSNFLAKVLIRRALGRALVRTWLPFVAVPITAAWNGVVSYLVLREATLRAMGPSAAHQLMEFAFRDIDEPLSDAGRAAVVRAVASSIVRTEDMHPNLVALLREVIRRVSDAESPASGAPRRPPNEEVADIDDPRAFVALLAALPKRESTLAVKVVGVAAIMDARLTRAEKELVHEARAAVGLAPESDAVGALRKVFASGQPLDAELVDALSR